MDNREYVATICVYCRIFRLSNFWIYPSEFLEYISGLNIYCWYSLIFGIWNFILSFFSILFHIVPVFLYFYDFLLFLPLIILSCVFELIFGIFIEICYYFFFFFLFRETYSLYCFSFTPFFLLIYYFVIFFFFLVLACYFFLYISEILLSLEDWIFL